MEEKQINNLIEDINSLIINNINKEINESYEKVNNILRKYLDDLHIIVPKEKYGIDDNEISDKEITKYMKKFNNDETKTIEAILKKLKYIK